MKKYNVTILGASGVVGRNILMLLEKYDFPVKHLKLLASSKSAGKGMAFKGRNYVIEEVTHEAFKDSDIVFGAVGNDIAKTYVDDIIKDKAVFIDNSSSFRLDDNVPLVVPEINGEDIRNHQGVIANPNCSTIIGMMVVGPLHKKYGVESIVVSTYQAVSGAGEKGMEEYCKQLDDIVNNKPIKPHVFKEQIVSNVICEIGSIGDNGYTSEEMKFQNESRKILHNPDLRVSCTCVRVPVLRSHSLSMRVKLKEKCTKEGVIACLNEAKGLKYEEDVIPMPLYVSEQQDVIVGRLREDLIEDNCFNLWCVGDQILKGAAQNAVQIALEIIE